MSEIDTKTATDEPQDSTTQTEEGGAQSGEKTFTQDEVNKIVSERLARERAKSEATYTKAMIDVEARENAIADREKAFEEKEKALAEKENRLFAIKAIKNAGLDDGSDTALELVDFVIAGDNVTEDSINKKVTALKSYVDKHIAVEVDKIFKANGRTPSGATNGASGDGEQSLKEAFGLA